MYEFPKGKTTQTKQKIYEIYMIRSYEQMSTITDFAKLKHELEQCLEEENKRLEDVAYAIAFLSKQLFPFYSSFHNQFQQSEQKDPLNIPIDLPQKDVTPFSSFTESGKFISDMSFYLFCDLVKQIAKARGPVKEYISCHKIIHENLCKRDKVLIEKIPFLQFHSAPSHSLEKKSTSIEYHPRLSNCYNNFLELSPSKETIDYLSSRYESLNQDQIIQIHKEIIDNEHELAEELISARQNSIEIESYFSFPPLDVIRENPQYQSYQNSSSINLNYLRSELSNFSKSLQEISNSFQEIKSNFSRSCAISDSELNKMDELVSDDAQALVRNRKLLMFKDLSNRVQMSSFKDWKSHIFLQDEIKFLDHLLDQIQSNPSESELTSTIVEAFPRYDPTPITQEISQLEQSKRKKAADCEKNIQMQGQPPNESLLRKLYESRTRVQQKESEFQNRRRNFYNRIQSSLKLDSIQSPVKENISEFIEQSLPKFSEKAAMCEHLKELIQIKKKETERARQEAKKNYSLAEKYKNQTISANNELQELQKRTKEEIPELEKIKNEIEQYKEKYFCGLCSKAKRDCYLAKCGHTYCRNCVDELIKTRSRKCPICNAKFAPHVDDKPLK